MDGHFLRVDRIDRHVWIDLGGLQRQSSPLRSRCKRGAFNNAIGRSRGGQTTKIHALTDEIGRPLAFLITPGNTHDLVGARDLTGMVRNNPRRLLADRAYDARSLRDELAARRIKAVIPPNPTRKHPHRYDKTAYKGRIICRRWKEWVTTQVKKYEWDIEPDEADHPTIHGLRGTGILARAEQGYKIDQIANDIGMSRQNVQHSMRFKDQMKVAADGRKRLQIVGKED